MTKKPNAMPAAKHRPLRLLVNGIHAKSGGGVTYLRDMLPELAQLPDAEVHLFLHEGQFPLFHPLPENVRVSLFDFSPSLIRTLIWEQFAIPILAWSMGTDVVFSPANYGPIFARNHVILLRNAVAVFQVARSWDQKLYWLAVTAATFLSLATCRRAIAVSEYAKRALSFGFSRILGRKVRVVHHGSRFTNTADATVQKSPPFLLAVSDIYIQKNYHSLIAALALLVPKYPDIELRIAGRELDREYMQSLRDDVERLDLTANVTFLGHVTVERLCELYATCAVFVFPSTVETFGNPLVEAMACGSAIAASNVTSIPEVLGGAGVLFDPLDPKDIAAKIETMIENADLRHEKRILSLERAREFPWSKAAQKTLAVMRDAVGPMSEKPRPVR